MFFLISFAWKKKVKKKYYVTKGFYDKHTKTSKILSSIGALW